MILSVRNLDFIRQRDRILDGVSFDLKEASITGLTGPNGGGKTTLFEILLNFRRATGGEIKWHRPLLCAYVPQVNLPRKVLPLTVKDFVEMGTWGPRQKQGSAALTLEESLESLHLHSISEKLISELSGGEWKRASLARSLVQAADLYFLDEPFNHLDLHMENQIGHLLQKLKREKNKTFFVISHDWHAMDHFFDHLLLLNVRLIAEGSVREISDISMNWRDPQHHAWMHSVAEIPK
ncbi:MAG: ATP-binding cassette domain-containing protein [Deltaproteobacteria bacterium]|nr:ATP-binding cassette domain-containing protein [Deltaproteobacteria bacterium]